MQELITYARNEDGDPTGVLVAQKVDDAGTVRVGWSACHRTDKNKGKRFALAIARKRIKTGSVEKIPYRMQDMIEPFEDRCRKYFKTDCIITCGSFAD